MKKSGKFKKYVREDKTGKRIIPRHKMGEAKKELNRLINQGDLEWMKIQESYDYIENCILNITQLYGKNKIKESTDDKISKETKTLIEKRNNLESKENKTNLEKIELLVLKKTVKQKIRKDVKEYEELKIKEILEESGSTKKVKKELSKIRKARKSIIEEIVETATEFFGKLYSNNRGIKTGWRGSKK